MDIRGLNFSITLTDSDIANPLQFRRSGNLDRKRRMSSWTFWRKKVQRMEDDFLLARLFLFSFDRTDGNMILMNSLLTKLISMLFPDTSLSGALCKLKQNFINLNYFFKSQISIIAADPAAFWDPWNLRLIRNIRLADFQRKIAFWLRDWLTVWGRCLSC